MADVNPCSNNHERQQQQHVDKKQKTNDSSLIAVTETAWEHFRNFLDSVAQDDDDVGDVDELVELLEILKPHLNGSTANQNTDNVSDMVQHYRSTRELLPVLCSVAHYHLADTAIVQTVDVSEENSSDAAVVHLKGSIDWFDANAATWSVGANYGRMTQRASPNLVCRWYQHAAECANKVRLAGLQLLDGPDAVQDLKVKEWIELLFLDCIVDSEYVEVEIQTEEGGDSVEEEGEGYFSSSRIEGISRFMASMLSSTAGRHDDALTQLQHFDLTHRLHPNVWNGVVETPHATTHTSKIGVEPVVYPQNALPPKLYNRLCEVFAPDAAYWKESDYAHRGYFSFFMDIANEDTDRPRNLIQDVIVGHLLPLAKKSVVVSGDDIVGAEWWVHTRPIQANLGHNLHFDTDEALLAQEKSITHPVVSSVLYLTGNQQQHNEKNGISASSPAGATIVLDQTPDSKQVADFCWRSVPRDNSYMLFPGNLLHGVLPCPGRGTTEATTTGIDDDKATSLEFLPATNDEQSPKQHRLTFMVGFWTRRVPDKMEERRLYGPCGPMPPATEHHSWVMDISKGYEGKPQSESSHKQPNEAVALPRIYPAWEDMTHETVSSDEDALLQLPSVAQRIDHRFFVKNAPQCFRDSLFKGDSDDE